MSETYYEMAFAAWEPEPVGPRAYFADIAERALQAAIVCSALTEFFALARIERGYDHGYDKGYEDNRYR